MPSMSGSPLSRAQRPTMSAVLLSAPGVSSVKRMPARSAALPLLRT